MEKFFKLKENNTSVKTEIVAGITTFLSIAYILAVNPTMLASTGMDKGAVFTATAVSAAFATLLMGLLANYPVALASGMGVNAYFAYAVCPMISNMGIKDPWKIALTAILVEGVLFIILSLFKFRETMVNSIPLNLKYGISAGIGLFISLVGLKDAGIVVADPATLVNIGSLSSPEFVLAMVGFIAIAAMWHYNIKGSVLWGILITWIFGIVAQLIGWYQVSELSPSLIPAFSLEGLLPPSVAPTFCKFDFSFILENIATFATIVFAFLFVDLFDTVGTLVGVADQGNLLDKDGKLPRVGRALTCDAIGTVAGSILGTSTVTSYVESVAGVAVGGRTGLTAVTTAVMFVVSLFLSPIFLAIPGFATAPALVFVGLLMIKSVKKMSFEGDIADVAGGFTALIFMPFTYSIANGIMYGILVWFTLKLITGKIKEIHPIMWVITALFAFRIYTLIVG